MKIAHVIPTYVPAYRYGGPIRAVHGLARAQAAAGHEVEVFTTDGDGDQRLAVPTDRVVELDGHRVHYSRRRFPRRIAYAPALRRGLARRLPELDVVHLHSVFLWPTAVAGRLARSARKPYLVSPRGMLDRDLVARRGALRKRLWIALVERRNLAGAARIVVTSEAEARGVRALGLALAPIARLSNGVDLAELDQVDTTPLAAAVAAAIARGPFVLYLGRLSWKKRIDLLIDALARLDSGRLLVAGPDDERLGPALLLRATERGVADRVELLGEVAGAERRALLREARALALVSIAENFGNVVLESMAAARPVVVSAGVGLASEVEAAGAGAVVDGTAEAVAAALGSCFADSERAAAAGANGRAWVERNGSWSAVALQSLDLYHEVATR